MLYEIPYTHDELRRLRERLCVSYYQQGLISDPHGLSISEDLDTHQQHLVHFFDEVTTMLSAGIFKGGPATKDRVERQAAHMEANFYRQYKVLFLDPIEDMPLLINTEGIADIVNWRLEIAK
jgi:hypothetical protein